MKTIITIGIAIICAFFGTAAAFPFAGDSPPVVALFVGSFIGGLYIGNMIATPLAYKPKRRSSSRPSRPNQPPRSFSDRLDDYQGSTAPNRGDTAHDVDASRMPFWMLDISHDPTQPKPASFIRRILVRIRHILNQNRG